ncbi:MAG: LysM peptidoglycan-binding domain-containing protein [Oligoflexales bacterium]|nr:LysM peptidoglycan-binding domain-containing protein [Oligoflexales bacterium]
MKRPSELSELQRFVIPMRYLIIPLYLISVPIYVEKSAAKETDDTFVEEFMKSAPLNNLGGGSSLPQETLDKANIKEEKNESKIEIKNEAKNNEKSEIKNSEKIPNAKGKEKETSSSIISSPETPASPIIEESSSTSTIEPSIEQLDEKTNNTLEGKQKNTSRSKVNTAPVSDAEIKKKERKFYSEKKSTGGETIPDIPKIPEPNEFSGAPPIPGSRKNLADGEAPEEYLVQPGDTLFDICDQLIDDGGYWPKLWALNPQIKNPHFIYQNMRLRFYPGDKEIPPSLKVISEDDLVPIDKNKISESELVKEDISKLLLKAPEHKTADFIGPSDVGSKNIDFDLLSWGTIYNPNFISVIIPGFIFENEIDPIGEIRGGANGKFLGDSLDEIVVNSSSSLTNNQTYTILRKDRKIYTEDGDYVGVRYDFVSHMTIVEKIAEDSYIGKVSANRLGARPDDILVEYLSTVRRVPTEIPKDATKGKNSEIVAFEYPNSVLGDKGTFVFFDKLKGTLNKGDTVDIYQRLNKMPAPFLTDPLPDKSRKVGTAYIIDDSGSASIGYVINNESEIRLFDSSSMP